MGEMCSPLIVGNLPFSIIPCFQKVLAFLIKKFKKSTAHHALKEGILALYLGSNTVLWAF